MKLSLYGNKPIILARDPQMPMEAAMKRYVDDSIATHASNTDLHLTASQNELLDNLLVGYTELNQLAGITDNVQSLLNSKLNLTGGTLTGSLYLVNDPLAPKEAATKNYVDAQDSLRVSKSGDTMSGPLTLSQDPVTNMHAATKQYVDVSIATHANNLDLHLTSEQNTLLDSLTVTATEINRLSGITANINDLLNLKFDKAGGLITGDVIIQDGHGVYVSKAPQAATELVNKNYVDSLIHGLKWEDPVAEINLVADDLSAPPASPVVGDVYIVAQGATGAWQGLDGYAVFFDGAQWVKLQDRPVQDGDRFGVALTTSTQPSGGLASLRGQLVTVSVDNGQYSYSTDFIAPGFTTLVHEEKSEHFGESYTLRDDNTWVNTNTGVNTRPGDGLYLTGKIINVGYNRGLTLVDNKLEAKLSSNHSLMFDGANAISVALADNSLAYDSDGIRLSDATNALIADKSSKTQSNTITGQFVFTNTSNLKAQFSAIANDDVVNKGYVDTADNNLQAQITSINTTVTNLNADPVTKNYVDEGLATKVNKAGDTMTGYLTLSDDPVSPLHAVTKRYIDTNLGSHAGNFDLHLTSDQNQLLDNLIVSAEEINQLSGIENNVQAQLDAKLNLTGGVLTGDLLLASDPTVDLQAATKHYVDIGLATKVNKAGDTMTGALLLYGEPTSSNEATTKNYVDTSVNNLKSYTDAQLATKLNLAVGTLTGNLVLASDPTTNLEAATKQYVDNGIASAKAYTDAEAANLQSQINSINTTVEVLNTDPVTKNYVDQGLATKFNRSGDTMMGYLTLFGDPTEPFHAATKQYVDAVAQGLSVKPSVRLATTENLDATYDNGNQGVGATLQANSNGVLVIDGVTPIVGDRILIKNQDNKKENGDYVVQQVGSDTTPYILKRDKFYDENYEIPGSYFYVYDGQTLKGTSWVALVANPVTFLIGRDDINITQFFGQGTYIPGNGISIDGTTINVVTADSSRIVSMPGYIDLAPTGVTQGFYTKVYVDGFGRVMHGSNPTTLAGYGISDGQPLNANLTSLSNLTDHGIVVRDNTNSMVAKAIGVQGVGLTITNGSGVDNGNIVISSNATSENTPATIVARDSSGNFSANVISAELDGNASSATKLANYQNFSVTGDAHTVNPIPFNGTGPVQLDIKLNDTGVIPGQYTRVVVGSDGRITLADNPNTVSELGLIDAATIDYVNNQIDALNQRINDLYTYVLHRLG